MILITGASGLLGINLVAAARQLDREVAGLCCRHKIQVPGVRIYSVDLTDHHATRDVVEELRPTSIIHCAAETNVDWCEDHACETERINVQATGFLAALAQELAAQFVYVSTDAVFDGKRGNYREDDVPNPPSVYAKSKLRAEWEVVRHHGSAIVVRTATVYGWNAQPKQSLAEWFLDQICRTQSVTGFTDVHSCPMLANDSAEALLAMLDRKLSGLFHLGGAERISKYEFAKRVALTFDLPTECIVPGTLAEASLRAPRSLDLSLCTEKVRAALGRQMPGVEAGLQRFRALRESGYADRIRSYRVAAS